MASSRDLLAKLDDEFQGKGSKSKRSAEEAYTAADIEVLEGLEPVRRRPGMYIGGTDERAMHHLFAEVIDNSMDEAVAGHATFIEVRLDADGFLSVSDNGRGIPVDAHPKFKTKSALEVIMTTLHSGGKFDGKAYQTSGGLHGVGVSVVNALSDLCEVEVARGQQLYRMVFSRGAPQGKLQTLGSIMNRRGTKVRFKPDEQIFGKGCAFKPARLLKMARSKAYLFGGVEIRWSCDPAIIKDDTPAEAVFHFPGGLKDYLLSTIEGQTLVTKDVFAGRVEKEAGHGTVEWAIAWTASEDGFSQSYCNTIPTAEGGTHENGLRGGLSKSLRAYGELVNNKKAQQITAEDVMSTAASMLSQPSKRSASWKIRSRTRSTITSPTAPSRRPACSSGLLNKPKIASSVVAKKRSAVSRRHANCGCRASSPTARRSPISAPRSSSSKATRLVARPRARATARRRRSFPCVARS
jgi:topoisomerase IV subunit B